MAVLHVIMNQHINEHMCLLVYLYAKNELKFIHIIMSHIYKMKSNTTLPHLNAHTAHVHLTCISSQHDILALASYNECSYYSCFLGASLYRIVTSWCQLIYSVAKSCQNHTHTHHIRSYYRQLPRFRVSHSQDSVKSSTHD